MKLDANKPASLSVANSMPARTVSTAISIGWELVLNFLLELTIRPNMLIPHSGAWGEERRNSNAAGQWWNGQS